MKGVGIKNSKANNLTLLGKWKWKIRLDNEGHWFRALVKRNEANGGVFRGGNNSSSLW
jgi:hypothetical protein